MAREFGFRKGVGFQGRKGMAGGVDDFRQGSTAGEPERSEGPGEHEPLARFNPPGSTEGDGFSGGIKPLKRRCKAEGVLRESAGAERGEETLPRSPERRKALKGEAHERWRLKQASKGLGVDRHAMRVAKPYCVTSGGQGNAFRTRPRKGCEEKDPGVRICCRADKLQRGAFRARFTVDVGRS
jgi:hypothetical protein